MQRKTITEYGLLFIIIVNLNGVLPGVRSEAYKRVGKRQTTKQDFKVNYYNLL